MYTGLFCSLKEKFAFSGKFWSREASPPPRLGRRLESGLPLPLGVDWEGKESSRLTCAGNSRAMNSKPFT